MMLPQSILFDILVIGQNRYANISCKLEITSKATCYQSNDGLTNQLTNGPTNEPLDIESYGIAKEIKKIASLRVKERNEMKAKEKERRAYI